jgi:hypothetical protein
MTTIHPTIIIHLRHIIIVCVGMHSASVISPFHWVILRGNFFIIKKNCEKRGGGGMRVGGIVHCQKHNSDTMKIQNLCSLL